MMGIEYCVGGGGSGSGPDAPANFVATGVSTSAIDLDWDDVADETFYVLERSTDGINYSFYQEFAAGTITFTDSPLPNSTQYWYRLRAVNDDGISSPADDDASTLVPVGPPVEGGLIAHFDFSDSFSQSRSGSQLIHIDSLDGTPLIDNGDIRLYGRTSSAGPEIQTAGLGGLDYLRMSSSSSDWLEHLSSGDRWFSHTSAQTVYILMRVWFSTSSGVMMRASNVPYYARELDTSSNAIRMQSSGSALNGGSIAAWSLVQASWGSASGTTHSIVRNSNTPVTGSVTYSTSTVTDSKVTFNEQNTDNIDIAEIVISTGTDGATGQADMVDYTNTKWGTAF